MSADASSTPTQTKVTVAVLAADLQYIKRKIDQMCGQYDEQDKRLDKVERLTWMISGVGALMAAILVPVAAAAIKRYLGL